MVKEGGVGRTGELDGVEGGGAATCLRERVTGLVTSDDGLDAIVEIPRHQTSIRGVIQIAEAEDEGSLPVVGG